MKKGIIWAALALTGVLTLSGCRGLDVIGDYSVTDFGKMLTAAGDLASDEDAVGWSVSAPDGEARFLWSGDFSKTAGNDVVVELSAQPFLDAGLDPSKLPEHIKLEGETLVFSAELGDKAPAGGETTAVAAYEQIVDQSRSHLSYHAPMGHYGIMVGEGAVLEWAQDLATNSKDLVFALDPAPFLEAGVDPAKLTGWTLAKVDTMESHSKTVQVDKLLKFFDLA